MHVHRLSLLDFRNYADVEVVLGPGVTAFIGPNGQGKTNIVEAVNYCAIQQSHRVSSEQSLVRQGADRAVIGVTLRRGTREVRLELEINPAAANRARVNQAMMRRAREALGLLRAVVFSPEDLTTVKGDPSERRRFLDDLMTARHPRLAGVRSDYDRILRQRNTLLKSAGGRFRGREADVGLETLDVWDAHLCAAGAELVAARLDLVREITPHVVARYSQVAGTVPKADGGNEVTMTYRSSSGSDLAEVDRPTIEQLMLAQLNARRRDELDRGISLVGPHRDDLLLGLGSLPVRGYASHGECWSFALALKLAAFEVLRDNDDDPVLMLDDVFAELDDERRNRLAELVAPVEQVLITAAVSDDVPAALVNDRFAVRDGKVLRD